MIRMTSHKMWAAVAAQVFCRAAVHYIPFLQASDFTMLVEAATIGITAGLVWLIPNKPKEV